MLRAEQVNASAPLREKFPRLKSLKAEVEYYDSSGAMRLGGMNINANVEHAKSLFCFNCNQGDCVGGDFDLSGTLGTAIAGKKKVVSGELRCQGIRHNKERKLQTPCQSILRYTLKLAYS